jgi:hypothetical protein
MAAQNEFLINTWNHGKNPTSAIDMFRYLRNGIALAGRSVGVSPTLFHNAKLTNVLVEHFTIEIAENILRIQKESGLRFVLVASELVTGDTFNNIGIDHSDTPYADSKYWQNRYNAFAMLVEGADAIWLVSEYQRPGYEQNFPNATILTVPMCFDPIEAAISETFKAPKLYEALFMGSKTTIREELLDALEESVQLYTPHDVPAFMVNSVMQSAQVCLHLHLKNDWPFTSPMRHHIMLTNRAYVISEKSELPGELDDFVEIVPRESLVDVVAERVQDKTIIEKGIEMQRQYADRANLGNEFEIILDAMS